jgi:DNA-3-methyladenine glycosylase II
MSTFVLKPVPPFRLDLTVWALHRLPINIVDRWDGRTYRRVLTLVEDLAEVAVEQTGPPKTPEVRVTVSGGRRGANNNTAAAAAVEKLLGLNIDLAKFHRLAGSDQRLAALVARFAGLKPPRLGSVFETALNGIACQQLSLNVGIHLLNRLSLNYGLNRGFGHSFPRPLELAGARVQDLRRLGLSGRKAENMIALSRSVTRGDLNLESLSELDDASAIARLLEIPGVGRWTAEYILLRGLGRLDVFPAGDVGSQGKLQRWRGLKKRPDYDAMHKIIDRWSPYRGLIYFYLVLNQATMKGLVTP